MNAWTRVTCALTSQPVNEPVTEFYQKCVCVLSFLPFVLSLSPSTLIHYLGLIKINISIHMTCVIFPSWPCRSHLNLFLRQTCPVYLFHRNLIHIHTS
ncbi:hypothetical protein BDF19DRAFT_297014 [Syncephalis fuscata]|nr:hypothetical protein BDF19DRAFT_297014 [Syncephalis fuscata]